MNSQITYYNNLKKFFLNRDFNDDKLKFTQEQLGEEFKRFIALYAYDYECHEYEGMFRLKKSNKVYHAILSETELFRTLSHFELYKHIANSTEIDDSEFVLVAEDNNEYNYDFREVIDNLLKNLNQPQYESAELVLLSGFDDQKLYDYVEILSKLIKLDKTYKYKLPSAVIPYSESKYNIYNKSNPSHVRLYTKTSVNETNRNNFLKLQEGRRQLLVTQGFDQNAVDNVVNLQMNQLVRFKNNLVTQINYQDSYLNNKNVKLFPVTFLRPAFNASSCYLIRKSTCQRIVKQHKRPFWYAGDFKQIIPVQNILLISPFICRQLPDSSDKFYRHYFTDNFALLNKYFRRTETFGDKYHSLVLRYLPFLQDFQFSTSSTKRLLSLILEKVLLLRYFGKKRN